MGKLINLRILKNYGEELQNLFTSRQLELIRNKLMGKKFYPSEKVFYSRSINKKIKAIEKIFHRQNYFVFGEEDMLPERKKKAIALLKKIERNHKGMEIFIAGGFLWKEKYNDIDVFIISKYDKEDKQEGNIHYNYFLPDEKNTVFFASLAKICVANFFVFSESRDMPIETFLGNYQELIGDIEQEGVSVKNTLRTFLLNASYVSERTVLSSKQLDVFMKKVMNHSQKMLVLRKIFVASVLTGYTYKTCKIKIENLRKGYESLEKEYGKSGFYEELIKSYNEVLGVEA